MLYNFIRRIKKEHYYTAVVFVFGIFLGALADRYISRDVSNIPEGLMNTSSSGSALESSSVKNAASDFSSFWRAWTILEENFAAKSTSTIISQNDKIDGAILGLANSYKDPYTTAFIKEGASTFKESVSGKFEGIGAVLSEANGNIVVQMVINNSPAEKAGILPGDLILSVDGVTTKDAKINDVINKIRGKGGTIVTLSVFRNGTVARDYKITRGDIVIPSVLSTTASNINTAVKNTAKKIVSNIKSAFESDSSKIKKNEENAKLEISNINQSAEKISNDLYFIRLGIFSGTSDSQIKDELTLFEKSSKNNLIIDLRGNPGGLIGIAQEFASYFLPKGTLVVSEVEGKTGKRQNFESFGYNLITNLRDKKIIILVDRNSASASEIFAAALKENNIATLIGEKTFGKGSVQSMVDLNDHITLKVTVARWYTSKGASIDGEGVMPNIIVPNSTSTDAIMDRAIQYLIEGK